MVQPFQGILVYFIDFTFNCLSILSYNPMGNSKTSSWRCKNLHKEVYFYRKAHGSTVALP